MAIHCHLDYSSGCFKKVVINNRQVDFDTHSPSAVQKFKVSFKDIVFQLWGVYFTVCTCYQLIFIPLEVRGQFQVHTFRYTDILAITWTTCTVCNAMLSSNSQFYKPRQTHPDENWFCMLTYHHVSPLGDAGLPKTWEKQPVRVAHVQGWQMSPPGGIQLQMRVSARILWAHVWYW